MTPILGIWASQISGHLYDGPYGAYDALATVTVPSGGVSSVTFSGIPTGYKHLELRMFAQTNRATYGTDYSLMRINGDSGSNYSRHYLYGDGSSVGAGGTTSGNYAMAPVTGTTTASNFSASIISFLDYASTNKNKTIRALTGDDVNGTVAGYGGELYLLSSSWLNSSSAISSITFTVNSGGIFTQYSSFALYGIK